MNKENKQLTSKQRFDQEIKGYNAAINGKEERIEKEAGFSDEEVAELDEHVEAMDKAINSLPDDEEEVVIDKNMGTTSISMTQEQFNASKMEEEKQKFLGKMTGVGGLAQEKLSDKDAERLRLVLQLVQKGTLKHPVLEHFITKKIEVAKAQIILSAEIKESQMKIMDELSKLTKRAASNRNSIDVYNKEILSIIDKESEILKSK